MRHGLFRSFAPILPLSLSLILSLILSLVLGACSLFTDEPRSHGGGSDTETLSGTLSLSNGQVAARTLIKLVPANYNPSKPDSNLIRKTMSDDSGHFRFTKLNDRSLYNLIAGKPSNKIWVYADSLKADGKHLDLSLTPAQVLIISLESPDYTQQDSGLAYFLGTDILTRCNGMTPSQIDSLPHGVNRLVVSSRAGWAHDTTLINIKDSTEVKADKEGIKWLQ